MVVLYELINFGDNNNTIIIPHSIKCMYHIVLNMYIYQSYFLDKGLSVNKRCISRLKKSISSFNNFISSFLASTNASTLSFETYPACIALMISLISILSFFLKARILFFPYLVASRIARLPDLLEKY